MVLSNFALGTAQQCCQTSPLGVLKDCQTSPLRKYFCTRVEPSCSRAKFYNHVLGGVAPALLRRRLGALATSRVVLRSWPLLTESLATSVVVGRAFVLPSSAPASSAAPNRARTREGVVHVRCKPVVQPRERTCVASVAFSVAIYR